MVRAKSIFILTVSALALIALVAAAAKVLWRRVMARNDRNWAARRLSF